MNSKPASCGPKTMRNNSAMLISKPGSQRSVKRIQCIHAVVLQQNTVLFPNSVRLQLIYNGMIWYDMYICKILVLQQTSVAICVRLHLIQDDKDMHRVSINALQKIRSCLQIWSCFLSFECSRVCDEYRTHLVQNYNLSCDKCNV